MAELKPFGTQDRPVILDLSQLIERVVWGTSDLFAVLLIKYHTGRESSQDYLIGLKNLPFGKTFNLNVPFQQRIPLTTPIAIDEAQISKDMRSKVLAYEYNPQTTSKTTTQTLTSTVIDRAHWIGFVNGFPALGGDFATSEEAYAGFRVSYFQLFGTFPDPNDPTQLSVGLGYIIDSHTETVTKTIHTKSLASAVFLNLSLIAAKYLPINNPSLEFQINLGSGTSKEGISWTVELSTWRNNKKFPVKRSIDGNGDAKMEPNNWDLSKSVQQRSFTRLGGGDFPPMPLTTLTFRIDCVTLQITKAQMTP